MRLLSLSIVLVVSASAALPGPTATAGNWPSEQYSSIPKPVTLCPAGDLVYTIVLHSFRDRPLRNTPISIAFDHCASVHLAPVPVDEGYRYDVTYPFVGDTTDANAQVEFPIRAGGVCPLQGVWIHAVGAIITRALASPDQNGDLVVSAEDRALAASKLGTTDPTADLNADGQVTAADLDVLDAHIGHQAPGPTTPTISPTWGRLKLLYR